MSTRTRTTCRASRTSVSRTPEASGSRGASRLRRSPTHHTNHHTLRPNHGASRDDRPEPAPPPPSPPAAADRPARRLGGHRRRRPARHLVSRPTSGDATRGSTRRSGRRGPRGPATGGAGPGRAPPARPSPTHPAASSRSIAPSGAGRRTWQPTSSTSSPPGNLALLYEGRARLSGDIGDYTRASEAATRSLSIEPRQLDVQALHARLAPRDARLRRGAQRGAARRQRVAEPAGGPRDRR